MQAAKNAAEAVKEKAANIGASAKAGMEKSKAVAQEKTDKMTAHTQMEKEMAEEKKNKRMAEAEYHKQEAKESNAAARRATSAPGGHPMYSTGGTDNPTGATEVPAGRVTEGTVESRPMGVGTGTGGTTVHKTRVE
ncbi:Late embryogenesis abundant protein, LEA_1 subgroup [Dillenia turbinata]|uniref:Late embryogenesis abundant protein, LEA_1 subgroup n=1 Tax=Dillenia turbinata TaxID=194707 RepID=A0AAN8W9X1_9MAGN